MRCKGSNYFSNNHALNRIIKDIFQNRAAYAALRRVSSLFIGSHSDALPFYVYSTISISPLKARREPKKVFEPEASPPATTLTKPKLAFALLPERSKQRPVEAV